MVMMWYCTLVFIYVALMIADIEHLLMLFHVGNLHIFGEMLFQALFSILSHSGLLLSSRVVLTYSGYQFLIRYMISKYFILFCGLPFYSIYMCLWCPPVQEIIVKFNVLMLLCFVSSKSFII